MVWILAQGIFESVAAPVWGALSRAVGEPVPLYPYSMLAATTAARSHLPQWRNSERIPAGLDEVQPMDHLVLLRFMHLDTASVHKLLRFPTTEALLDFLSQDLPLHLITDLNERETLYGASSGPEPDPVILRGLFQVWYDEAASPELEMLITRAIRESAAELGIGDRYKLIEASLEWVGQPYDLGRAPVPFLEELREGLSRSMGQAPTTTDILQLLIANDRVSAFFGEFLIGWEVLPGESRMDLSKEDLEEARQTLQGWWEDVETQPQPLLAEMWRPRYESIRSGMEP